MIILLPATLFGCSEAHLISHAAKRIGQSTQSTGVYKVGKPYQIDGIWYYPSVQPDYDKTGIASWYGSKFHGRSTANGERFDMTLVSAAHNTLPMPTMVLVTNLENGRSLKVRVNDRGPFAHGRIIDMSMEGARLLGFKEQGTAKVRVQVINQANEKFITARPSTSDAEANATEAAPVSVVERKPLTDNITVSKLAGATPQSTATKTGAVVQTAAVTEPDIFVQAGAFSKLDNANRLSAGLDDLGEVKITSVMVGGREFFRVRIGPIASVSNADKVLAEVIAKGQKNARIILH